jgi:Type II secretion system (T2SS), protein F
VQFRYDAVSADGARESGSIAARDERAALKALAAQGLTVLAIGEDASAARTQALRARGRIRASDRALAVRQLAGLIEGGVTLPNALASVAQNSESSAVAFELNAVKETVVSGASLNDSFAKAQKLFPSVERQVVVAGAEAGDLSRAHLPDVGRRGGPRGNRRFAGICNAADHRGVFANEANAALAHPRVNRGGRLHESLRCLRGRGGRCPIRIARMARARPDETESAGCVATVSADRPACAKRGRSAHALDPCHARRERGALAARVLCGRRHSALCAKRASLSRGS